MKQRTSRAGKCQIFAHREAAENTRSTFEQALVAALRGARSSNRIQMHAKEA